MKIKSKETQITYANKVLIAPGGYFDGDAISDTLDTTSTGIDLVNAPYKRLENYKNVSCSRQYSVVYDFTSVDEAVLYKLDWEAHITDNPRGFLHVYITRPELDAGNASYPTVKIDKRWLAACTQLGSQISIANEAVRLTLSFSFLTSREAEPDEYYYPE